MWSHYTNNQKGYCLEFDLEPGNFIGYNNKKINSKNVDFKKLVIQMLILKLLF
ncbi:DUF2971 domain-containing protein [Chryseobacterium wanjuense]